MKTAFSWERMVIEHEAATPPEHKTLESTRMNALRTLAEPLIGHALKGETLARMIERVARKDAALPDLQAELDRLYAEKD